jgi:hypothetical protein
MNCEEMHVFVWNPTDTLCDCHRKKRLLAAGLGDICLPKIQKKWESGEIPPIVLPSGKFSAEVMSDHYDSPFARFEFPVYFTRYFYEHRVSDFAGRL